MENIEAAEKLKLSAENLNSVLSDSIRKISATKKRTKKLKAVSRLRNIRKRKETKLEIPSFLKKSAARISKQVSAPAFNLFGNILGFVSLILFGTLITNADKIQEEINKAKDKLKEDLKPLINIGTTIYNGAKGFVDLFDTEDRDTEYNKILEENKKLEKIKTDFLGLSKNFKEMEKIYQDISEGKYAETKIEKSGVLADGESFNYYRNRNPLRKEPGRFVITYPDGSTEKLTYTDFITRYGNQLQNIIKPIKDDTDLSFLYNVDTPFIIDGLKFNYKDLNLDLLNDIDFVNRDNTNTVYFSQRFFMDKPSNNNLIRY